MVPLSHLQQSLLATAANRSNLSLHPLPAAIGRARSVWSVRELLADGLIEERETAEPDAIVHEFGEVRFGYFMTAAGLAALDHAA